MQTQTRLSALSFGSAIAFTATILTTSVLAGPTIVVDAADGRVLLSQQATDPWYPASVTKLMTAYVALKAVKEGRLTMDTPLKVSALAAAQAPSKMGFKPGTEVTLDNALKIIMVKSANDVAMTIGENIGGSVDGFAEMMNREAARLGMRESRFANPNGLPDERNQTSARDLATLARALLRDFPDHHDLWSIGAIQYGNRIYKNTNGLIGRYDGGDGMKTGFICASGFNVVATATRNGRTLIAVVLGASSGAERTLQAAQLFDQAFAQGGGWGSWSSGVTLDALPASFSTRPPNMRDEICGPRRKNNAPLTEEDDSTPLTAQTTSSDNPTLDFLMANAGKRSVFGAQSGQRLVLGPRTAFTPVQVFTGRTPGSDSAPTATAAAPGRKGVRQARGRGTIPATAEAYASGDASTRTVQPSSPVAAAMAGRLKQKKIEADKADPKKNVGAKDKTAKDKAAKDGKKDKADAAGKSKSKLSQNKASEAQ